MIFPRVKHANTKIQIHKYTNTLYDEVPERPNMWYIFEKRIVQGYQKWYFHESNMRIQKYKYANTQIHKYIIWWGARKTQHVLYFWKEDCSRISKMIFPWVKHANTKIQIHKYIIWRGNRKTQHVVYFWKGDCSRISKMTFPWVKYANIKIQI